MGCAIEIVKLILFIFNLVFALCGLGLLSAGVMYKLQVDDLDNIVKETNLAVAPTALITIGAIIFVISFFGCCGAIRENHCMVVTYAVIMLSLLIMEIAIGVYIYWGDTGIENADTLIQKTVSKVFADYKTDKKAQKTFDVAQESLHCCGVEGPFDYTRIHTMFVLPRSCCKDPIKDNVCTYIPTNIGANYWTEGCLEKLRTLAGQAGTVLSIILFSILGVEIVGILFSLCLANSIKNAERRMGMI